MARINRLKARQVETLKTGFHSDGGNLFLSVKPTGARSWVFRWKRGGKTFERGIGAAHAVTLAQAREIAQALRSALVEGRDPGGVLAQLRPASGGQTFRDCAQTLIDAKRPEWRNVKHAAQWTSTLEQYAYPEIGNLAPSAVELSHVVKILAPLWTTKTETATRLRQRIEHVLDYAAVHGLRDRERVNPARWRGLLDKVLPKPAKLKRVRHHPALPYSEVAAVLQALVKRSGPAALALRFLILTTARSGEVRGATWDELDLDARTWTIPGARMKAGREHRVPLTDAALRVLKSARAINPDQHVFAGLSAGNPLSSQALTKALRAVTDKPVTVHGMRSAFRDWASEQTASPREVIEAALAHVNRDKVEAAYLRSDLFEKRRALMQAWERHCIGAGNVVRLARRGK